ncbi:hypothetical protein BC835DRAFT_1415653 [Cytidiella melzeri]|nr:hypothetical protein BC835DRAFT_1415653 [Cytidiella melzeri]
MACITNKTKALDPEQPPIVRRLRLDEVVKALRVMEAAIKNDPLHHYLRDTPDANKGFYRRRFQFEGTVVTALATRKHLAWTIGDVFALMMYEPADKVEDTLDMIIGRIMLLYGKNISPRLLSKGQARRLATMGTKMNQAIDDTLGDRKKTMYRLADLATHPDFQRRGYGSALTKFVTEKADAHGRATWLMSSNILNTGFYNSLGFITKAEIALGSEDPDWCEPPVVVSLMVREVSDKSGHGTEPANEKDAMLVEY